MESPIIQNGMQSPEKNVDSLISVQPKKKNFWYGKIETKDEAIKIIKEASNGFYILAVVQIIGGVILKYLAPEYSGIAIMVDGVIVGICAFLLRKFNSKIVAIILILFAIAGLISSGGKNIILPIIAIWISVRAIQATFGLKKFQ